MVLPENTTRGSASGRAIEHGRKQLPHVAIEHVQYQMNLRRGTAMNEQRAYHVLGTCFPER